MLEYPIYIAGNFEKSAKVLDVYNPFKGYAFARTYQASDEQYEVAVNAALACRKEMAELPAHEKYNALRFISYSITANRQVLSETLCYESGKPIRYALAEVDRAAQTFLVAAEEAKRIPKEYISLDWTAAGNKKEGLVKYFPSGVIAGITPFNFPLNLVAHKVAPAIAAGCPIVLKPASSTPLSSIELAKIIAKTNLPVGVFSVLPMDRTTGNKMVIDERFSVLSFTGSPIVGWEMKKNAGKKRVLLELGGNAAVIISKGVNLEEVVKKSLVGGFSYSGQVCIHAQRFFVHKDIFEKFSKAFAEGAKSLKYGDPKFADTDVSVMIDQDNADRVEAWVEEAKDMGATVLCGGIKEGGFYLPTIITGAKNEMKVYSEEIFGPVITLDSFSTIEEAVDKVNDSKFGLQAGVFTNSVSEMDYAFNNLNVGGVILNDMPTFRADHMPYGGVKDSGLGREGVRYAMMEMMEARILVK